MLTTDFELTVAVHPAPGFHIRRLIWTTPCRLAVGSAVPERRPTDQIIVLMQYKVAGRRKASQSNRHARCSQVAHDFGDAYGLRAICRDSRSTPRRGLRTRSVLNVMPYLALLLPCPTQR
jgi:hypothetical protein